MEPRSERGSEVVGVDVDIVARDDVRWQHSRPNITLKLYTALSSPRHWLSTRAWLNPTRTGPAGPTAPLTGMRRMRPLTAPDAISHPSSPPPRIPQMSCLRCRKISFCMALDYDLHLTSLISTSLALRRRVCLFEFKHGKVPGTMIPL